MIFSFLGLIITVAGYRQIEGFSFIGIVFAILAVLSFSIGTIIQKNNSYCIIKNLKIQYLISSLLFLIPICFGKWTLDLTFNFILSLAWMVFIVSVGATFLLLIMIKSNQISRVSSLFFCVPPLSMVFDYLFFSGKITLMSIIGTIITIFSVRSFFILTNTKINSNKKTLNEK